jgi:hypothetical protein
MLDFGNDGDGHQQLQAESLIATVPVTGPSLGDRHRSSTRPEPEPEPDDQPETIVIALCAIFRIWLREGFWEF